MAESLPSFDWRKHVGFYLRHLSMLPQPYISADTQRMTLGYFALSALDLLGAVDEKLKPQERQEYADWIYEQQCSIDQGGGFRGSPATGSIPSAILESSPEASSSSPSYLGGGNLAMTYTALLSLGILRDPFKRLDRKALLHHLHSLQQEDGSFAPSIGHGEFDCRFLFCAFAICKILDDWSAIDVDKAIDFLKRSRSFDGAFGQAEGQEAQGGSTYCAVASLSLAERLDVLDGMASESIPASKSSLGRADLERWLLSRQQGGSGFNGRIEKPTDTCYSFWCGAAMQILGCHNYVDSEFDIDWILSTQSPIGGISKTPGDPPDLMHSYLSTAALALHAHDRDELGVEQRREVELKDMLGASLQKLDPSLNLSETSKQWLQQHIPVK